MTTPETAREIAERIVYASSIALADRKTSDPSFADNLIDAITAALEADRARSAETIEAWTATANQNQRNADYYRGLVVKIGETFGDAAYIQDDGGRVTDVLCAKVPELAARSADVLAEAERSLDLIRTMALKAESAADAAGIHSVAFCALRDLRAAHPSEPPAPEAKGERHLTQEEQSIFTEALLKSGKVRGSIPLGIAPEAKGEAVAALRKARAFVFSALTLDKEAWGVADPDYQALLDEIDAALAPDTRPPSPTPETAEERQGAGYLVGAIFNRDGSLRYIGTDSGEVDTWRVALGWPDDNEIMAAKAQGLVFERITFARDRRAGERQRRP